MEPATSLAVVQQPPRSQPQESNLAHLIEVSPQLTLVNQLDRLFQEGKPVNLGIPSTLTKQDINYMLEQIGTSIGRTNPFAKDGYQRGLKGDMHDRIMEQINAGKACVVLFKPGSMHQEASYSITTK